jgi:hypothetical protein
MDRYYCLTDSIRGEQFIFSDIANAKSRHRSSKNVDGQGRRHDTATSLSNATVVRTRRGARRGEGGGELGRAEEVSGGAAGVDNVAREHGA